MPTTIRGHNYSRFRATGQPLVIHMLVKLIHPALASAAGAAFILGTSLVATPATAQEAKPSSLEQVVVTATRSGTGVRQDLIGSSITVIEPIDLERRQTRIVSDACGTCLECRSTGQEPRVGLPRSAFAVLRATRSWC